MTETANDLRERLEAFNLSQVARDINISYMRLYRFMREGRPLKTEHEAALSEYINTQHTKTSRGRKAENYLRRALAPIKQDVEGTND